MKPIVCFILFLMINTLAFAQGKIEINPVPRQADFEYLSAPDSLGARHEIKVRSISGFNKRNAFGDMKIPYPIIFIHGLASESETWNAFTNYLDTAYQFSYGGRIDYCLNYDGNNAYTNSKFSPAANADIALFTGLSNLIRADYYYINFNVGSDGSYKPSSSSLFNVLSNQQAIVKQGLALRQAINMILQLTGRDKVILMGHSMVGLAARQYLQNTNIWQPDSAHHVAKLVTTGTPHGGSNSTSFGFGAGGVDEQSEAVRDLRRSYFYSSDPGVFLYGGMESNSVMNDMLFSNFYNTDVNCNGAPWDNIVGLNQKNIYTNLDYACIIGECSGCIIDPNPGDGVVWDVTADLQNYYSGLPVNKFIYNAFSMSQIHTDLPKQSLQNMEGLDEPNEYYLSYGIHFDTTYTGFITGQPVGGYMNDYDDYKFSVGGLSNVNISVNNTFAASVKIALLDSTEQLIDTFRCNPNASLSVTKKLNAGSYYLELAATPDANSWHSPYTYSLHNAPLADFSANVTVGETPLTVTFSDLSKGLPSAWVWSFPGALQTSSTVKNPVITYNTPGTYPVTLVALNPYGGDTVLKTGYIKVNPCTKPTVSFTFGITNKTVSFTNSSANATSYNWDFGDGQNSVQVNPVHAYAAAGTYQVNLSATNTCGTNVQSKNVLVTPNTSARGQNNNVELVYPNPSSGEVNVKFAEYQELVTVTAYDMIGRRVFATVIGHIQPGQTETLNFEKLSDGTYFLRVNDSIHKVTLKQW